MRRTNEPKLKDSKGGAQAGLGGIRPAEQRRHAAANDGGILQGPRFQGAHQAQRSGRLTTFACTKAIWSTSRTLQEPLCACLARLRVLPGLFERTAQAATSFTASLEMTRITQAPSMPSSSRHPAANSLVSVLRRPHGKSDTTLEMLGIERPQKLKVTNAPSKSGG